MRIKEHDCVILTDDLPADGLKAGDAGTVVHVHGKNEAYEVEFATRSGTTVAVATVLGPQLRRAGERDIALGREIRVGREG